MRWVVSVWLGLSLCAAWCVWAVVERQGGVSVREAAFWPAYGALRAVRWVRKRRAEHAVEAQAPCVHRRKTRRPEL